jgi:uncharacterized RDD family membrane protein YckC
MTNYRPRVGSVATAVLLLSMMPAGATLAQTSTNRPTRVVGTIPAGPDAITAAGGPQIIEMTYRSRRPIVRIGQDYTVRAGEEVEHVVTVWGSVTIDGRVEQDVVVVLGDARLGSTAQIDGSLIVVAGGATIAPGARVRDDLVVAGGVLEAPTGFWPGGEHIIIGPPILGNRMRQIVPWVTRGLLWGRPIVPDLGWVWAVFGVVFLISLALNHLFDRPVRASAQAVMDRPLGTFLTGVLVMIVAVPIMLLLAASVIGIIVLPFLAAAGLFAWAVGKVGVVRAMGLSVLRPREPEQPMQPLGALVVGFVMMGLAYMVPILGGIVWALIGVFGLGAGTIAFLAAFRREYPRKPKPTVPAPTTPGPPPVVPGAGPGPFQPAGDVPLSSTSEAAMAVASPPVIPDSTAAAPPPGSLLGFPRGRFLDRVAAFALDLVLVAIAVNLFELVNYGGAFFLTLLLYHIAFWSWKGTTLGGIVVGLRVIRADGAHLQPIDAIVRGLSSLLSFAALGLGCFWMITDPERQTWHDKIAGTYVVKVPKNLAMA